MTFTLNAGEFDLGGGFIGLNTSLTGASLVPSVINLLFSTSGLVGDSKECNLGGVTGSAPVTTEFRSSSDSLSGVISLTDNSGRCCTTRLYDNSYIANNSRFQLTLHQSVGGQEHWSFYPGHLNSSLTGTKILVASETYPEYVSGVAILNLFRNAVNWRFLARDHATALTHYPSTLEEGSVFAASCVNSPTQWGLWLAGEVGDRSGYFNQTQGYFAIVILRNGSTWYISAFTPAAASSISRNDNVIRSFNIVPALGQTGADRFSEFFIARDLGNGFSETIGKIPGFIYVDMNQAANSALTVGSLLEITPGVGTTYDLTNHGAIVVAQWGLDISATVSNVGSTFTVDTASTPSSASLSSLNRTRTTLEENQRIQITATPPTGLSTATNYWVKNWNPTALTFELSATEGGATIVPSSNTNSTITRYAGLIAMPCYQA